MTPIIDPPVTGWSLALAQGDAEALLRNPSGQYISLSCATPASFNHSMLSVHLVKKLTTDAAVPVKIKSNAGTLTIVMEQMKGGVDLINWPLPWPEFMDRADFFARSTSDIKVTVQGETFTLHPSNNSGLLPHLKSCKH